MRRGLLCLSLIDVGARAAPLLVAVVASTRGHSVRVDRVAVIRLVAR